LRPRVSVVIPVYNGQDFVARAIRSALEQTLRSVEVLVADNGSTDRTWEVLEALAAEDPRVRITRALEGRGANFARNACLEIATGEWVAVLDADDSMHPARLEVLLDVAARRDAVMVADNQRLVTVDGRVLGTGWTRGSLPAEIDAVAFVDGNIFGRPGLTLGYLKPLIRRDVIEAMALRYINIHLGEDYQFVYDLLAAGHILHICPQALYDYTQVPGSLSRSFDERDGHTMRDGNHRDLLAAAGDARLTAALTRRERGFDVALVHWAFVGALKRGRLVQALAIALGQPATVPFILRYGAEGVAKRLLRLRRRWHERHPAPEPSPLLAYFGQDCTDSAVIRRIAAFQAAGLKVLGFTFRRRKFNQDYRPAWDDVALGETRDRDYRGRLPKLARAALRIAANARALRGASVFYARNIDMALLAWIGQVTGLCRAPLVYEVLDVQRAFLGRRRSARLLRWLERRVLAHARLLVVSSPAFVESYFLPLQGYAGDWFLLENKVFGAPDPVPAAPRGADRRWVIGWFGTLRCVRSLTLLAEIAAALPDQVRIDLRGLPTETGLEPFLAVVRRHPNMSYGGEYVSPGDLAELYGGIDFAWCLDFLDEGANSDWLLPNRYYDCGCFAVPALAAARTQTGRRVAELGSGWTFQPPFATTMVEFLRHVTAEEVAAKRAAIAALPRSLFVEEGDTKRLVAAIRHYRP